MHTILYYILYYTILYYTILYYTIGLGAYTRLRYTYSKYWLDLGLVERFCCCAHAMASVCVAGPSRSGETAEEQTVSKHGSYR